MFVRKTSAQLEAMSDAERDNYASEKAIHEQEETQKLINNAVDAKVTAIKTDLEANFIPKSEFETKSAEVETLKNTVEAQGIEMVAMKKVTGESNKESLVDAFKSNYEEVVEKTNFTVPAGGFRLDTSKVTVSTDVMSVNTVNAATFPAGGSTGVVGAGVQTLYARLIGYFSYRKPYSPIMDVVDIMPLDQANLIVINETVTGDAAITPECTLKPIVKIVFATQEASADPVAVEWATTTKLRRFFPSLVDRMLKKFGELVMDKIPTVILARLQAGATAFTPNAALAINANPNNYDAIGAVLAQLENLGFVPDAIIMNPIAWRNMKQDKTADGVYTLSNGQSITLVGDTGLDWGGRVIPFVKDPTLAVDQFIIGDIFNTVKVGLDSELLYFETDGRTDAVATVASGLSRNIRTHVLEKFVAIVIPTATAIGLVSDTFTNVKTLITAEE